MQFNRTTCAQTVRQTLQLNYERHHNIQLRNKQLRDKAGTIAGKVVAAEGRVAKEGSHMMVYTNPCIHDDVYITKMCDTQEIHIWHISSHEYAHQDIHISLYIYIYIYICIYISSHIYIYIYLYSTPGNSHQAQGIWHTRRYTPPHTSVHTQLVHQEAHRPPQSRCIYSLCNRMHEYTNLLTYKCIHGWPTDRNTSPHIHVHTWCVVCTPVGTQTSSHACACIRSLCA